MEYKISSFFEDVFYSLIKFLMIGHHGRSIPTDLLPLLKVTLHLPICLYLTPPACFPTPYRLPIINFIIARHWLKCWFVHFSIGISVPVTGILWDILDGIGLGDLKWVICLLSLTGIGVHILASRNGPYVSGFAFWGLINRKIGVVTIEGASLGLFGPVALLDVIFVELWVHLGGVVEGGSHWLGLNNKRSSDWPRLSILRPLYRHLQVFLWLNPFLLVANHKPENIF